MQIWDAILARVGRVVPPAPVQPVDDAKAAYDAARKRRRERQASASVATQANVTTGGF